MNNYLDDITSFQAGVDTIYNGCKTYGSTPAAKTPTAIVNSIKAIYTNRYNEAISDYSPELPYYVSNASGYIVAYYPGNGTTDWSTMNLEAGETAGLFELSFSLKNITKLICSIYSMNTSYSTTVRCYISLSTTIPKNLTEMQSSPFYSYGTYGSKK